MNVDFQNVQIENLTICNDCDTQFQTMESVIKLPKEPALLEKLKEQISSPDDLDSLTRENQIPANLINFHLATPKDLSFLGIKGLDRAVHLPVQISSREGGRSSLYRLRKGETALAGIYVNSDGIILRNVTRESGTTRDAKTGDKYRKQLTDRNGRLVYEGVGELEVIDAKIGYGKITYTQTDKPQLSSTPSGGGDSSIEVWVLWSCSDIKS